MLGLRRWLVAKNLGWFVFCEVNGFISIEDFSTKADADYSARMYINKDYVEPGTASASAAVIRIDFDQKTIQCVWFADMNRGPVYMGRRVPPPVFGLDPYFAPGGNEEFLAMLDQSQPYPEVDVLLRALNLPFNRPGRSIAPTPSLARSAGRLLARIRFSDDPDFDWKIKASIVGSVAAVLVFAMVLSCNR